MFLKCKHINPGQRNGCATKIVYRFSYSLLNLNSLSFFLLLVRKNRMTGISLGQYFKFCPPFLRTEVVIYFKLIWVAPSAADSSNSVVSVLPSTAKIPLTSLGILCWIWHGCIPGRMPLLIATLPWICTGGTAGRIYLPIFCSIAPASEDCMLHNISIAQVVLKYPRVSHKNLMGFFCICTQVSKETR